MCVSVCNYCMHVSIHHFVVNVTSLFLTFYSNVLLFRGFASVAVMMRHEIPLIPSIKFAESIYKFNTFHLCGPFFFHSLISSLWLARLDHCMTLPFVFPFLLHIVRTTIITLSMYRICSQNRFVNDLLILSITRPKQH